MTRKDLPSPEMLRKLLRYEPETGKLFWRERTPDMFSGKTHSPSHSCATWNSRYANAEAFTTPCALGYFRGSIYKKKYLAHRVGWAIFYGEWPEFVLDHIDGNPSNNKIENIRQATMSQNQHNRGIGKNNTSGHPNVFWNSSIGKWSVAIMHNKKMNYGGGFDCIDQASDAARRMKELLHGDFRRTSGKLDAAK